MSEPTHITVRGASVHNLRDVDVRVPRNALVVFTGVSGSGKSSLAFDTIYKEGQRRFMESLSAYARQFLGQMERPQVESVVGVSPTISIDQKTVNRNPRSTVGTITELYDHLRLMMARLGTPHCPVCGEVVSRLTSTQIIDTILSEADGQRLQVLGPVVRDRKGEYRRELEELRRDGWIRARIDGEIRRLDEEITLARYEKHTIEVVVDRLVCRLADRARLAEAIETGLRLGDGVVGLLIGEEERTYSVERGCADHPEIAIPELEPRLFSFNAPQGACPTCSGLGALAAFDPKRVVDHSKPALESFRGFNDEGRLPFGHFDRDVLKRVVSTLELPLDLPVGEWAEDQRQALLFGVPGMTYEVHIERGTRSEIRERPWVGLVGLVERVYRFTGYRRFDALRVQTACPACMGQRLNAVARSVTFRGRSIVELVSETVDDSAAFFGSIELSDDERQVGAVLFSEICDRLHFLVDVGLGYLSLDRSATTLSGGEAQRIRLAAQVGSALQGVTYVLDEPSIGLHPRDNERLLRTLFRLRDRGNSVLVVEHDEETILGADHVVDVGPGAGSEGGLVVASTTPGRLRRSRGLTGQYLRRQLVIPMPEERREPSGWLRVVDARLNNLDGVTVEVPLGVLVGVTGVSGSGKSSLVFQVLERSLTAMLQRARPVHCKAVEGAEAVDKVIRINQQPIGRTPRSNPATYTKSFDIIRELFASTPEAKARGYKKGRFSFNVDGGRCEACEGAGVKTIEMQFLPSVEVPCEVCGGARYNRETLEIHWKGTSIADVLRMTVAEAEAFFEPIPKLKRILSTMRSVGLGYVPLGQPSTTLSGGEAQRVKLATELHRPATGRTIYFLDEPTTGLHLHDVRALVGALQRLVDAGNTVVVVEHHSDVVKCADHLIDMGPDGGRNGGRVIGAGSPEWLSRQDSPTGRALAKLPEFAEPGLVAEVSPRKRRRPRQKQGPPRLVVRGARLHNLQSVDVDIPHGALTVVTGVSGSGKSSLAFDTIFAEGQRRYVESLSTYARRFLGRLDRAPVDRLEGLRPAIAIDQRVASQNPRSTVATVTEIHDVLRLLWARVGTPHCTECDRPVRRWSPGDVADDLRDIGEAGWLVARLRPAELPAERRASLLAQGWTRLLAEGPRQVSLEGEESAAMLAAGALLVIDRINPSRASRVRVSEAVSTAYTLGAGSVRFISRSGAARRRYTSRIACPDHGDVFAEDVTPRHFSFNSRLGACPVCDGLGRVSTIAPERLFPRAELPFWDALDARVASVLGRSGRSRKLVDAMLAHVGIEERGAETWSSSELDVVLNGLDEPLSLSWKQRWGRTTRNVEEERRWLGLLKTLESWSTPLPWLSEERECGACHGGRLKPELLAIRVGGMGLRDFSALPVSEASQVVSTWSLEGEAAVIAERPLLELSRRLSFLIDVGLGYLALDRTAGTLSGGEAQRIRLASQLGSSLTGVVYVLDEPTIGLHPRDTGRLLRTLEGLRDNGNTVLVVEHDPDTIRRADHVIDMGPAAGRYGGQVLAVGTPEAIEANASSVTGAWLSGRASIPRPAARREPRSWMTLHGPRTNNLVGDDVRLPTGCWVAVSGVSGSGKSSLVMDTLVPALVAKVGKGRRPGAGLDLSEGVDRVVVVDQAPIGRNPRSTPATYTKLLDPLRKLFASIPGAQMRGWKPGRFSYNAAAAGGRCAACEGRGAILVEMHFLPDVWVECESCGGRRFNRETLEVRWKGRTIADVLAMRADEALELFANQRSIARRLQALTDVGLGYLTLGQAANTLSGGEAQRVKLAAELTSRKGRAVYVLDEPTTGLHLSDVAKLVEVLHRLVEKGHTVITIEHHLDVLAQSDWVVEMGPEGGASGGRVIFEGTPEALAEASTPTGDALTGIV